MVSEEANERPHRGLKFGRREADVAPQVPSETTELRHSPLKLGNERTTFVPPTCLSRRIWRDIRHDLGQWSLIAEGAEHSVQGKTLVEGPPAITFAETGVADDCRLLDVSQHAAGRGPITRDPKMPSRHCDARRGAQFAFRDLPSLKRLPKNSESSLGQRPLTYA
jgi:hypothetical protein